MEEKQKQLIKCLNCLNALEHYRRELLTWYRSPNTARKQKKVHECTAKITRVKSLYIAYVEQLNKL